MVRFLLLAIFGLVAQLIDGSLGMAYGVTSSTLLLSAGVLPAVASASVHLSEVGTCLVSGASHWRFGNTDWRAVLWLGLPGGIGAFCGAVALSSVSAEAVAPLVAMFLFLLGAYVLVRFAFFGGKSPIRPGGRVRGRVLLPLGVTAGFLDAAGGGGWGPIATPTLLASGKMQPRKVVGTVDTSEFMVALCASIGFLFALDRGVVALPVVGALLLGGVIAAPLAAWLVRFLHPRILGSAAGGLILLTNGRTMLRETGVAADLRYLVYAVVVAIWIAALAIVFRSIRTEGHGVLATSGD